jgi:hypothetical protein
VLATGLTDIPDTVELYDPISTTQISLDFVIQDADPGKILADIPANLLEGTPKTI